MNIDEVESGKGLIFLPSGHWTQDVVDKIKESNSKKINTEYLIGLVAYCKRVQIPSTRYGYLVMIEDRDLYLGLSRWHYQQRRVRARREKAQAQIKRFLLIYPQARKVMATKIGRRNFIRIYVKD